MVTTSLLDKKYITNSLIDFFLPLVEKNQLLEKESLTLNYKKYKMGVNIKTIHITGWICYLAILLVSYISISNVNFAIYQSAQTIVLHSILFYINFLILMPKLMEKNKYVHYFFSLLLIILAIISLFYLFNIHVKSFGEMMPSSRGLRPGGKSELMAYSKGLLGGNPIKIYIRIFVRYIPAALAVVLLSVVFRLFSQKIAKEKQEIAIQNEQLLSEMKFLKSQVNPHFLFNALNNVYTLVHLKHKNAPTMLIKLSDMLRYMLYECNDEWVNIEKEITYINNYIELQQLKTAKPQNIRVNFNQIQNTTLIPPLLLIPFIENSFKHSRIEDVNFGWVTIDLTVNNEQVQFKIVNSKPTNSVAKDETGGIGLENVKRRLELLYPNKYDLIIEDTDQEFKVSLNFQSK